MTEPVGEHEAKSHLSELLEESPPARGDDRAAWVRSLRARWRLACPIRGRSGVDRVTSPCQGASMPPRPAADRRFEGVSKSRRCLPHARLVPALSIAIVLTVGCGRSLRESAVIRVGGSTITASAIKHWISLLALRQTIPEPPKFTACIAHLAEFAVSPETARQYKRACRQQYDGLRRSAINLLITDQWFIGQANEQGAPVSDRDVDRRLEEKYQTTLEGEVRLKELLGVGGRTMQDVRLEVQAELAAAKVRRQLVTYASATSAPSPTHGTGGEIVGRAKRNATTGGFHEYLAELSTRRRVHFVAMWRTRWTARTSCAPAYVVQKCKEFHGSAPEEDTLEVN